MGRLSYTWQMMKMSWSVLMKDKELLLFPIFSGIGCLLVFAGFFVPLMITQIGEQLLGNLGVIPALLVAFAYYTVTYFVVFFFNTAIIGCAVMRLRGGDPTVADGFRIAGSRIVPLLGWSLVAATVGMILHALEKQKIVGRIVAAIIGAAWSLLAFLAVPILVVEGKGPFEALSEAKRMLSQSWGTQVASNFMFGVVTILLALPLVGLVYLGIASGQPQIALACMVVAGVAFLALAVVQSALHAIFQSAVYLHLRGETTEGFDADRLAVAAMFR